MSTGSHIFSQGVLVEFGLKPFDTFVPFIPIQLKTCLYFFHGFFCC